MAIINTRCCVVGGGPAGMMLGLLLARAGIEVIVLEKHADFLRDFRGDTIHPSTLEVMYELGMLDELLKRPHQKVSELAVGVGDELYKVGDLSHLPCRCKFIAFMPQWDFLNFLAEQGKQFAPFHLQMESAAEELLEVNGRCVGVSVRTPSGLVEIKAEIVIGADGRHSTVRAQAGLESSELGAPMDVLWFRVQRKADDPEQTLGRFAAGRIVIMINRGAYWQCGFVIRKGSFAQMRGRGLEAFRVEVASQMGLGALGAGQLESWDEVKLLTVTVDRLHHWSKAGLLCIGDAAHAMSPIGGVGINLAIQDAVATANILAPRLLAGSAGDDDLRQVQKRRERAVQLTQYVQLQVQKRVVSKVLSSENAPNAPLMLKLANRLPLLRRLPARLVGLGFKPEHVRTPRAQ